MICVQMNSDIRTQKNVNLTQITVFSLYKYIHCISLKISGQNIKLIFQLVDWKIFFKRQNLCRTYTNLILSMIKFTQSNLIFFHSRILLMSLNFTSNLNFSTINIRRYNSFSMIRNVKYHNNNVTWPQAITIIVSTSTCYRSKCKNKHVLFKTNISGLWLYD